MLTDSDSIVRVRTFLDQDEARVQIAQVCSRFAYDVLALIDSATGPDGLEGPDAVAPEITAEYAAFRAWLGPELVSLAQSTVVGPIVSGMSIDSEGRVHIAPERYADRRNMEAPDRLAGRLRWLADEIPSLIQSYGELYENEVGDAYADVEEALCLDLEKEEDRGKASIVLSKLERWYLFAHPGARIVRNDPDAHEAALKAIEMSKQYLEAEGIRREDIEKLLQRSSDSRYVDDGSTAGHIEERLEEIKASLSRIERKAVHLEDEREALLRRYDELSSD